MKIFKITNITNLAGKRDAKFNSTLKIEYISGMKKLSIPVKAGETIFLKTDSLELSIHKLRVNNLIIVSEITEQELNESLNKSKPKIVEKPVEKVIKKNIEKSIEKNDEITKKHGFSPKKKNDEEVVE